VPRSAECLPIDSSVVGLPLLSAWLYEPEEDPSTDPRSTRHQL